MLETFGLQYRGKGCLRWTITDGYGVLIETGWAFGRSLGGFIIHGERSVKSYGAKGNRNNIRGVRLRRLPGWDRFMIRYDRFSPMMSRNRAKTAAYGGADL